MRLADRTVKASACAAIRELAAPLARAAVLSIELDRLVSRLLLERFHEGITLAAGLFGNVRVMRNNQPQVVPCRLAEHLLFCVGALRRMEGRQQRGEVGIASAGHRKNEFKRAAIGQCDRLQVCRIVRRQQAAIRRRDHALDRKAPYDFFDDGFERGDLGRVPVEHFVMQRQTFGSLHYDQHDLTRDQASFDMPKWRTSSSCWDSPSVRIVVMS